MISLPFSLTRYAIALTRIKYDKRRIIIGNYQTYKVCTQNRYATMRNHSHIMLNVISFFQIEYTKEFSKLNFT